jgi:hypothetical protein
MALAKFGPFAAVFQAGDLNVSGYLELLHLGQPTAQIVIDRIEKALVSSNPTQWVDALFADPDWRPHLVGAIALLLDDGKSLSPGGLWRAADSGSWVVPQLAVTAYLVDKDFPNEARVRIENVCPVAVPKDLSPLERHVSTGPGSTTQRSAKLMASLVFVGKRVPSLQTWLDDISRTPSVAHLLEQDVDNAPHIAEFWLSHLKEQFAKRHRDLKPKAT